MTTNVLRYRRPNYGESLTETSSRIVEARLADTSEKKPELGFRAVDSQPLMVRIAGLSSVRGNAPNGADFLTAGCYLAGLWVA